MKCLVSTMLLAAFLLNACAGPSLPVPSEPGEPKPLGQEIAFGVIEGTFTYLRVDGNNQDGEWTIWEKSYEPGRSTTLTEEYWWNGTVVLVFDITNVGRRSCVIDNLLETPESKIAAITYTEGKGCFGEGGSARQYGSEQLIFDYTEGEDGLKLVEAAGFAQDSTQCLQGIAKGFTDGSRGKVMVIVACGGASLALINEILSKYDLQVIDQLAEEPKPSGQQIAFGVTNGTFTFLRVDGTNQDGQWTIWEKMYETGQVATLTEGYWWKGTVVLVFDVTDVGRRSCIIDSLLEAPESKMAAITYTEGKGCTGEGGSAREYGSEQVLFEYMEAKDGLQLVEAASFAQDTTECLRGIAEGFTKGLGGKIMVIVACGGASISLIN